jgi:hypothetical protein
MELDTRRKLVIGSLDPRHTEDPPTQCVAPSAAQLANPLCKAGFYVISYANPAGLEQVGEFVELPAGHTTSCIQDCRYLWTGGPARSGVLGTPPARVYNPALRWLGPILGPSEVDHGLGLRLLDISDARDVRQIAYYRVTGTSEDNPTSNSWDMAFRTDRRRGDLLYLFDMDRGIEILRMKQGANASRRMKSVTAPNAKSSRFTSEPVGALDRRLSSTGSVSYVCPLFQ